MKTYEENEIISLKENGSSIEEYRRHRACHGEMKIVKKSIIEKYLFINEISYRNEALSK